MKKVRYLTAALCAAVLLCGCAFASGEAWEDVEPPEERPVQTASPTPTPVPTPTPTAAPSPEPTPTPSPKVTAPVTTWKRPTVSTPVSTASVSTTEKDTPVSPAPTDKAEQSPESEATGGADLEGLTLNPLTPDGQGSTLDNSTGEEGKEFFTITADDGTVFYLVIDRQKGGQNVYFLNTVTMDDLLSLAEPSEDIPPVVTPESTPTPDLEVEPEPDPEPEKGINVGTLILALVVVALGGGAGWYFMIYRPNQQWAADMEDEPEDDDPPWDVDDGEGGE